MSNELYVREIPKSCGLCQFCEKISIKEKPNGLLLCNIMGKFVCNNKECPLRSLADFENKIRDEEREKLIDALKSACNFINGAK